MFDHFLTDSDWY